MKPAPPPARPRPAGNKSGARAAAPPPDSDATNVKSMEDIVRAAPPRPARAGSGARAAVPPRRPPPAEPPPKEEAPSAGPDPWARESRPSGGGGGAGPVADPDELMTEAREFMGMLSSQDKIAFWGAATVLLSCFLPWKETASDGDVLGLMSMGFGAFLLSIAVIVSIGVRVRGTLRGFNPVVPWMAQLFTSFLCLVWCIIFIKVSSDTTRVPTPIGNAEMMNSSPSFGVFIAVLGALAALAGSFLGMKGKSSH